jgi:hypothetical protein
MKTRNFLVSNSHITGIPAGTSGTWVYTETTKPASSNQSRSAKASGPDHQAGKITTVYGQIIADDSLGDVYMVPLRDILNDIKDVLGARGARLPESNTEVDEILRGMRDTTIDDSQSQADDLASAQPLMSEAEATSGSPNRMWCTQCGSKEHGRNTCEVKNSAGDGGGNSKEALVPVVVTPYIPNSISPGSKGGAQIWYCSDCGDGPIGLWQSCCTACSHVRCAGCYVETSK